MKGFDAAEVARRITAGADLLGSGFPRDLVAAAPLTMPVSITIALGLTTTDVRQTLSVITKRVPRVLPARRLRGCLIAHRGYGMIFLDDDDEAPMRFALAHELAHFIGHYLARRELAIARLGPEIAEVIDGRRRPTAGERLGGILSGCPLGTFTDVIDRDAGNPISASAEIMEHEADEAAFLALAPIGVAIARTIEREGRVERLEVERTLIDIFGLSAGDADRHAPRVVSAVARNRPSLIEQLRQAASEKAHERHR